MVQILKNGASIGKKNCRVFICHGHDSDSLTELVQIISGFGLVPVVLSEQDDGGLTIIEKFEQYGEECEFAFALLTPDDPQAQIPGGPTRSRARQNVILELGWFMRKLGRRGVTLLHKADVEIPSDLNGVLYLHFNHSAYEVFYDIEKRLSGQGLINV